MISASSAPERTRLTRYCIDILANRLASRTGPNDSSVRDLPEHPVIERDVVPVVVDILRRPAPPFSYRSGIFW